MRLWRITPPRSAEAREARLEEANRSSLAGDVAEAGRKRSHEHVSLGASTTTAPASWTRALWKSKQEAAWLLPLRPQHSWCADDDAENEQAWLRTLRRLGFALRIAFEMLDLGETQVHGYRFGDYLDHDSYVYLCAGLTWNGEAWVSHFTPGERCAAGPGKEVVAALWQQLSLTVGGRLSEHLPLHCRLTLDHPRHAQAMRFEILGAVEASPLLSLTLYLANLRDTNLVAAVARGADDAKANGPRVDFVAPAEHSVARASDGDALAWAPDPAHWWMPQGWSLGLSHPWLGRILTEDFRLGFRVVNMPGDVTKAMYAFGAIAPNGDYLLPCVDLRWQGRSWVGRLTDDRAFLSGRGVPLFRSMMKDIGWYLNSPPLPSECRLSLLDILTTSPVLVWEIAAAADPERHIIRVRLLQEEAAPGAKELVLAGAWVPRNLSVVGEHRWLLAAARQHTSLRFQLTRSRPPELVFGDQVGNGTFRWLCTALREAGRRTFVGEFAAGGEARPSTPVGSWNANLWKEVARRLGAASPEEGHLQCRFIMGWPSPARTMTWVISPASGAPAMRLRLRSMALDEDASAPDGWQVFAGLMSTGVWLPADRASEAERPWIGTMLQLGPGFRFMTAKPSREALRRLYSQSFGVRSDWNHFAIPCAGLRSVDGAWVGILRRDAIRSRGTGELAMAQLWRDLELRAGGSLIGKAPLTCRFTRDAEGGMKWVIAHASGAPLFSMIFEERPELAGRGRPASPFGNARASTSAPLAPTAPREHPPPLAPATQGAALDPARVQRHARPGGAGGEAPRLPAARVSPNLVSAPSLPASRSVSWHVVDAQLEEEHPWLRKVREANFRLHFRFIDFLPGRGRVRPMYIFGDAINNRTYFFPCVGLRWTGRALVGHVSGRGSHSVGPGQSALDALWADIERRLGADLPPQGSAQCALIPDNAAGPSVWLTWHLGVAGRAPAITLRLQHRMASLASDGGHETNRSLEDVDARNSSNFSVAEPAAEGRVPQRPSPSGGATEPAAEGRVLERVSANRSIAEPATDGRALQTPSPNGSASEDAVEGRLLQRTSSSGITAEPAAEGHVLQSPASKSRGAEPAAEGHSSNSSADEPAAAGRVSPKKPRVLEWEASTGAAERRPATESEAWLLPLSTSGSWRAIDPSATVRHPWIAGPDGSNPGLQFRVTEIRRGASVGYIFGWRTGRRHFAFLCTSLRWAGHMWVGELGDRGMAFGKDCSGVLDNMWNDIEARFGEGLSDKLPLQCQVLLDDTFDARALTLNVASAAGGPPMISIRLGRLAPGEEGELLFGPASPPHLPAREERQAPGEATEGHRKLAPDERTAPQENDDKLPNSKRRRVEASAATGASASQVQGSPARTPAVDAARGARPLNRPRRPRDDPAALGAHAVSKRAHALARRGVAHVLPRAPVASKADLVGTPSPGVQDRDAGKTSPTTSELDLIVGTAALGARPRVQASSAVGGDRAGDEAPTEGDVLGTDARGVGGLDAGSVRAHAPESARANVLPPAPGARVPDPGEVHAIAANRAAVLALPVVPGARDPDRGDSQPPASPCAPAAGRVRARGETSPTTSELDLTIGAAALGARPRVQASSAVGGDRAGDEAPTEGDVLGTDARGVGGLDAGPLGVAAAGAHAAGATAAGTSTPGTRGRDSASARTALAVGAPAPGAARPQASAASPRGPAAEGAAAAPAPGAGQPGSLSPQGPPAQRARAPAPRQRTQSSGSAAIAHAQYEGTQAWSAWLLPMSKGAVWHAVDHGALMEHPWLAPHGVSLLQFSARRYTINGLPKFGYVFGMWRDPEDFALPCVGLNRVGSAWIGDLNARAGSSAGLGTTMINGIWRELGQRLGQNLLRKVSFMCRFLLDDAIDAVSLTWQIVIAAGAPPVIEVPLRRFDVAPALVREAALSVGLHDEQSEAVTAPARVQVPAGRGAAAGGRGLAPDAVASSSDLADATTPETLPPSSVTGLAAGAARGLEQWPIPSDGVEGWALPLPSFAWRPTEGHSHPWATLLDMAAFKLRFSILELQVGECTRLGYVFGDWRTRNDFFFPCLDLRWRQEAWASSLNGVGNFASGLGHGLLKGLWEEARLRFGPRQQLRLECHFHLDSPVDAKAIVWEIVEANTNSSILRVPMMRYTTSVAILPSETLLTAMDRAVVHPLQLRTRAMKTAPYSSILPLEGSWRPARATMEAEHPWLASLHSSGFRLRFVYADMVVGDGTKVAYGFGDDRGPAGFFYPCVDLRSEKDAWVGTVGDLHYSHGRAFNAVMAQFREELRARLGKSAVVRAPLRCRITLDSTVNATGFVLDIYSESNTRTIMSLAFVRCSKCTEEPPRKRKATSARASRRQPQERPGEAQGAGSGQEIGSHGHAATWETPSGSRPGDEGRHVAVPVPPDDWTFDIGAFGDAGLAELDFFLPPEDVGN